MNDFLVYFLLAFLVAMSVMMVLAIYTYFGLWYAIGFGLFEILLTVGGGIVFIKLISRD